AAGCGRVPASGAAAGVTTGCAGGAGRRGVVIEQMSEVVGLRVAGGRVTGVRTAAGDEIATPVVVNAAGLWCREIAAMAGLTLPRIVGRHPVFIVERTPGFGPPHPGYLDL